MGSSKPRSSGVHHRNSSGSRPSGVHHRKRYGHHQRQTKPFLKTYLPYLPLLTIILTGLVFGVNWRSQTPNGVLAYATKVNAPTLLEETNTQRAANGQTALQINDKLSQAAQAKADDMAKRNYWSHTTPDGQQPWIFFEQAGYQYQKAGENLAYGFLSSHATVSGWMNSPSHRANLLDSGFEEVGFGYANASNYQQAGANTIVVAMYGRSQVAAAATAEPVEANTNTQVVRGDEASFDRVDNARTYRVARIQVITNGQAPWSLWAILAVAGLGLAVVALKHSLALHRVVRRGEKFVMKHPLFDITLAAFLVLCIMISRAEGYILSARF